MHAHARHHPPIEEASSVRDPVCGMTVDPASAEHRADHAGASYFFCSTRCREKFEAAPARYVDGGEPEPSAGRLRGCDLHLPDASGNTAEGSRQLPDLRHGA